MRFQHRFRVQAPLVVVTAFHRQSASMGAITPPPVIVRVHQAPAILNNHDEMAFTLWLGPLPIHWLARIEEVTPTGFVDRQLRGPFQQWVHRHTFRAITPAVTEVIDEIELTLADHWLWKLVGWGMYLNLPLLFAYRAWQTKRLAPKANRQLRQQVMDNQ
jgi:ligand-binding SRPBCC domain-containing protein